MVKVCDAIMGSGKTSATISYINAHPEKRFVYVTPYLPEAARIKNGCPEAGFVEPSDKLPKYGFSKASHTLALIEEGRNIASTHQAMLYYTEETIKALKEKNYTVVIDEEVSVFQKDTTISFGDVTLAQEAGYIQEVAPDEFCLTEKADSYRGGSFSHMFRVMRSRHLVLLKRGGKVSAYYWIFPKQMFTDLGEVIVLTYLFRKSEMDLFFHINGIVYAPIWIGRSLDGGYVFSDHQDYVPEYVSKLREMITIESSEKMNRIGKSKTALSMNWYQNNPEEIDQLRKNICNYFIARAGYGTAADRMCGTYKKHWGKLRGKGYWNSDVAFSQKATNEFRDRTVLAYPVNLFASGEIVRYYCDHGETFDNDRYALSIMLQWIWRSAIRDGRPITLYIPSRRMRTLLINWIEDTRRGGDTVA